MLASQFGANRGKKLWIFCLFVLLATGLRLADYLADHSLNHDEAADAVNLIHRSYSKLSKPLNFWVVAPIGFLYVEKAMGQMLGYSELSLRLFPLLAGVALVPAFLFIADDLFGWEAACIGALLLGTERRLIDWSARLKPYGLDALLALLTFYVIYLGIRRGWSTRYLVLAALWGAIAQWFSFPLILVLAGMGAIAIGIAAANRQWRIAVALLSVCLLWVISFGLDRSLAMNIGATVGHVDLLWDQYFMPHSWRGMAWIPWALTMIFSQTIRLGGWPGLPLFVLLGASAILWGWDRSRRPVLLALSPIVPALLAAWLNKYPFGDRVLLYIVPLLVLIMAGGLAKMLRWPSLFFRLLAVVLLLAMVIPNLAIAANRLRHPRLADETRPIYAYILAHHQAGDRVYVSFFAIPTYDYYAPRMGLDKIPATLGMGISTDDLKSDLAPLSGRVWFVSDLLNVTTTDKSFEELLNLANRRGSEIDHVKISHVEAHLIDLEK